MAAHGDVSCHVDAAVDVDGFPGNVARPPAGKKHDDIRDILGRHRGAVGGSLHFRAYRLWTKSRLSLLRFALLQQLNCSIGPNRLLLDHNLGDLLDVITSSSCLNGYDTGTRFGVTQF